jgi:hypothetical protein
MFKMVEAFLIAMLERAIERLEPGLEEWLVDELKTLFNNLIEFVEGQLERKGDENE